MSNDFYTEAASKRLALLDAEKAAHLADLAAHKSNGDIESAANSVQALADLETQRQNLLNLHRQYTQSQQAPEQPIQTREEWQAKPVEKMTAEDGLEVMRGSRYGKDLDWNNPMSGVDSLRRGIVAHEANDGTNC